MSKIFSGHCDITPAVHSEPVFKKKTSENRTWSFFGFFSGNIYRPIMHCSTCIHIGMLQIQILEFFSSIMYTMAGGWQITFKFWKNGVPYWVYIYIYIWIYCQISSMGPFYWIFLYSSVQMHMCHFCKCTGNINK